jgi:hypothetical protein
MAAGKKTFGEVFPKYISIEIAEKTLQNTVYR